MIILVRAVNNWLSDISLKWLFSSPQSSLFHPIPFLPLLQQCFNFLLKSLTPSPKQTLQSYNCIVFFGTKSSDPNKKIQLMGRKSKLEKNKYSCSLERKYRWSRPAFCFQRAARPKLPAGAELSSAQRVKGIIAAIRGKSCGAASPEKSSSPPPLPTPRFPSWLGV